MHINSDDARAIFLYCSQLADNKERNYSYFELSWDVAHRSRRIKPQTDLCYQPNVLMQSPFDQAKIEDPLIAKGFRHYGIFADDPEALKLFDEIEEERNKHIIEPNNDILQALGNNNEEPTLGTNIK